MEPSPVTPSRDRELDDIICSLLRDDEGALQWRGSPSGEQAFGDRAIYHGVAVLLAGKVPASWPADIREGLRQHVVARAFWERGNREAIGSAIAALKGGGVEPIIFKGVALANDVYPEPILRERSDADIIVPPEQAQLAADILTELGFHIEPSSGGEAASYQDSFSISDPVLGSHTIDLHRRINNSPFLARLFSFEELARSSIPVPRLCAEARAPNHVYAMLLACMHRATHIHNPYYHDGVAHYGGDRLIWLYDLHLLAQALSDQEWDTLAASAREKELGDIIASALSEASDKFGGHYTDRLRGAPGPHGSDVSKYLRAGRIRQAWMDFSAIESSGKRARYLKEMFFPPSVHMRRKYPAARLNWLPWLYVRRAVEGASKRMTSHS